MSRYHFNIDDGVSLRDDDGVEFPDLEGARNAAVDILTEALRGAPEQLWRHGGLTVTVTDDTGLTLFVVEATSTDAPVLKKARRKPSR